MTQPSNHFLAALDSAWQSGEWSQDHSELLGLVLDMDAYWADMDPLVMCMNTEEPSVLVNPSLRNPWSRILCQYGFAEGTNLEELKAQLEGRWKSEIAYPLGEWEFVDFPKGFTFFFFTYNPKSPLFASGRADFVPVKDIPLKS